jgi:hypothetical protein
MPPVSLASGVLGLSLSKRKENPARKRNEPREGMDGTCCLVYCLQELKIFLAFLLYKITVIPFLCK